MSGRVVVIASGAARVFATAANGREVLLNVVGAGELLGTGVGARRRPALRVGHDGRPMRRSSSWTPTPSGRCSTTTRGLPKRSPPPSRGTSAGLSATEWSSPPTTCRPARGSARLPRGSRRRPRAARRPAGLATRARRVVRRLARGGDQSPQGIPDPRLGATEQGSVTIVDLDALRAAPRRGKVPPSRVPLPCPDRPPLHTVRSRRKDRQRRGRGRCRRRPSDPPDHPVPVDAVAGRGAGGRDVAVGIGIATSGNDTTTVPARCTRSDRRTSPGRRPTPASCRATRCRTHAAARAAMASGDRRGHAGASLRTGSRCPELGDPPGGWQEGRAEGAPLLCVTPTRSCRAACW